MKNKSQALLSLSRLRSKVMAKFLCTLAVAAGVSAALNAHAGTGVWTNAPTDANWANSLNWVGGVIPGLTNMTGNTVNADIAIFTNPITGAIGTAANPIMVDNATISTDRSRQVLGITFDGTNCGAYNISGTQPTVYPGTGILYVSHNGAIRMNAPVTNVETILCPILTRLPSSTAGVYNFINNALSPNGVLVITSVTNDSSSTRGTTFVLDGSNTGTNTIYYLSQGTTTGSAVSTFTKQGTGTWYLTGSNFFRANETPTVNNGLLIARNPQIFGAANTANVTSNGVLRLDAVSVTNVLALNLTGTVLENGSSTITEVSVNGGNGVAPKLATTSLSDVLTVGTTNAGTTNAVLDVVGGSLNSVLHVAGPGTVLLTTNATYTGSWSVDAGTCKIACTNGLGTGPNLNIAAGAVFDTTPLTALAGTFALTTSTLSANGTGTTVGSTAATINADPTGTIDLSTGSKTLTLTITPTTFTGDTTHPALYIAGGTLKSGNIAFSIVNNGGTPLGAGTYTLIQQAVGNVTDVGNYSVTGVSGSGLAAGTAASIQVSGGSVNLVVFLYTPKNLVWTGGAANENWDVNLDANWLNGASASVFNNADNAAFNSVGASNPVVTLVGTLAPSTVVVDTTATNYTFTGNGAIAGATSLVKMSPGTLLVQTTNTYAGGTVVSNGVLQLGGLNVIPDAGAGDVTVYGKVDMNGNSDNINALIGTGTVDTVSGGTPTLTIGNNNDSGTFSGVIQNTAGSLAITKTGTGTETLSGNNTYSGVTTVNNGTLKITSFNALGSGLSPVTINSGTLDLATSAIVSTLSGNGGVANNSTVLTNELIATNSSTFGGLISDGTGKISVLVSSGTLRLNANSTYSGGTYVAAGAGLAIGAGTAQPGTGGIVASNGATISQPNTGSSSSTLHDNFTTVSGATVTFTSAATANAYGNLFFGDATCTNIFSGGNMTWSGTMTFANFPGTVILTGGSPRIFSTSAGSDTTTFNMVTNGGMFVRDGGDVVHLGALFGDYSAGIGNPSVSVATQGIYMIGGKNIDSVYSGKIGGSNSVVKIGTGALTFNGSTYQVVGLDTNLNVITNVFFTNGLSYTGTTTVSNGTLKLVVPSTLTNSAFPIVLASSTAVLDGTQMGYIDSTLTNLVTNGVFEVIAAQSLTGVGTINASNALFDAGSLLNIGLPFGTLNVSQKAELAGVVTANLNATNAPDCGELVSPNIVVDGTASLIVTNLGPQYSNTFKLFGQPVSFASVTLPTLTGTNSWVNNLAVNGSITLIAPVFVPVNTNSTNITVTVSGTNLTLSWPADHTGWRLEIQTNTLVGGLGNNWVPLPGSSSVNTENLVIDPTVNGNVFYRLIYP